MDRTMMRRFAAGVSVIGMMMVGSASLAPLASASPTGYPKLFTKEVATGYTDTWTAKADLSPQCPQAIVDTPGSEPATKVLNQNLNTPASFELGGTVHYTFLDNTQNNVTDFQVQDCEVAYDGSLFPPGSIGPDGLIVPAYQAQITKSVLNQGTEVDGASLSGFPDTTQNMYFGWTVNNVSAGQVVCNFARDISNGHTGSGNRKSSPDCFRVTAPHLTIAKSVDHGVVNSVPTDVTYTVTVTNDGDGPAANVVMDDPTPANETFVSETQASGPTFTCTHPPTLSTGVHCTLASLAGQTSATFTIVDSINSDTPNHTTITNVATTSADGIAPVQASATTTYTLSETGSPHLTIDKAVDHSSVTSTPANVTYTVTVGNNGTAAATSVVMNDPTPTNETFVSESQTSGPTFTCTHPPTLSTGVHCTLASLAAGASASFTIVDTIGTAANGTTVTNTATASADGIDPIHKSADTTVPAGAPVLTIDKSVDHTSVSSTPTDVTYTVTVGNTGNAAASNVVMDDPTPANETFVSEHQTSGPAFTCSTPPTLTTGVNCTLASLAAGASATFTIVDTIGTGANGSTVTNTATVSATGRDPIPASAHTDVAQPGCGSDCSPPPPCPNGCSTPTPTPTTTPPTTTPPTTSTTKAPTPQVLPEVATTVAPTTTTTVPPTTTTAPPQARVLPETASRTLPFTGTNTRLLLLAGLGLILVGLGLMAGTWRQSDARHYRG